MDTSPAPVAVLAAPTRVEPGRTLALRLEPALPLATLAGAVSRSGGIGEALKGAMEAKEVLTTPNSSLSARMGHIVLDQQLMSAA